MTKASNQGVVNHSLSTVIKKRMTMQNRQKSYAIFFKVCLTPTKFFPSKFYTVLFTKFYEKAIYNHVLI